MPKEWITGLVTILGITTGTTHAAEPSVPAGETHRTANFVVTAPTLQIARTVAAEAERQRQLVALRWFGEAPPAAWPRPCAIRVTLAPGPTAGATTLDFAPGTAGRPVVAFAAMDLQGDLRHMLASTLPHEITHLALAHHFGKPLPRWADEGIALMSESRPDQTAHDARCRDLLGEGRGLRLRVLFRLIEYPKDLMAVYTQGHSVVRFLTRPVDGEGELPWGLSDTAASARLLRFLGMGSDGNTAESWDRAAKEVYGYDSVDALEEAWLAWLAKGQSVMAPGAAGKSQAPLVRDVADDMIPPTELPGSGQPAIPSDGGK